MPMDFDTGIPFEEQERLPGDSIERARERNRRLFLLGGAMTAMGGYLGPVYPLMLDPLAEEEEKDPNP